MFTATGVAQLEPMYAAIFNGAPANAAGAAGWLAQWKPIIDVVLTDFARPGDEEVTYGYRFASLVAAYEASNLPLDITATAVALGIPASELFANGSTLTGTAGADIFYMSNGDQTAVGGNGPDNYVMGGHFGHDVITDDEPVGSDQSPNTLRFATLKSTDITASRNGLDLVLTVNGTDQKVTVQNEFIGVKPSLFGGNLNDAWGVSQITFADGVVWQMPDIAWAVAPNTDGVDGSLVGTPSMDVLDGGRGNHFLSGGDGGDIYLYDRGDGADTIHDSAIDLLVTAPDIVKFGAGLIPADIEFSRVGNSSDLDITVNDDPADSLTIIDQFGITFTGIFGNYAFDRIEGLVFEDGTSYSWQDVQNMLISQEIATPGAAIYGFDTDDTIDPGLGGGHFMSGGNGNDTYVFGLGYGADTIQDETTNILGGTNNTVSFNADVDPATVQVVRVGASDDVSLILSDGSTLTLQDQLGRGGYDAVENFQFQDAANTLWTSDDIVKKAIQYEIKNGGGYVYGSEGNDVIDPGTTGNQFMSGGNGDDTYVFGLGYGHDSIKDGMTNILAGTDNTVLFNSDVTPSSVTFSRGTNPDDLVIKLEDGSELDVLGTFVHDGGDEVDQFQFQDASHTLLSLTDVEQKVLANEEAQPNSIVYGFNAPGYFSSGGSTLDGKAGNDTLIGLDGDNTFLFGIGYGHEIVESQSTENPLISSNFNSVQFGAGITPAMLSLSQSGIDVTVKIAGTSDTLLLKGQFGFITTPDGAIIQKFIFADGTSWDLKTIEQNLTAPGKQGTTAPVVTIAGQGGIVDQASLAISGTVDIADAGTTVIFLDSTKQIGTATVGKDGQWSTTVTLTQEGANPLTAEDTDADGKTGTASLTFTLDTTPPIVAITSAGGTIGKASQTVTGTVSDANPGATVSLYDNESTTALGTASVQADGSWKTTVTLAPGSNSLVATDTDLAGNLGKSGSVVFSLDPGPSAAIGTLTIGRDQTEDVTTLVNGLVTPGLVGDTETITALAAKSGVAHIGAGGVLAYTSPSSGSDTLTYTAKDPFGGTATSTIAVTVDSGPGAAAGTLTIGHNQTEDVTKLINGLVTPGLAGDSETVTALSATNGVSRAGAGGVLTYTAPATGPDTLSYTDTDQFGDMATNTIAVTVDPGPTVGKIAPIVKLGQSTDLTAAIIAAAKPGLAGDKLSITTDITSSTTGTVSLVNGDLTYMSVLADFPSIVTTGTATDSFGYTIADKYGDTASGTVALSVTSPAPAVALSITGTGVTRTTNEAPVAPFTKVVLSDANDGGANVDTLTISQSGAGTLADGAGFHGLSTGSVANGDTNYTLTGTAVALTSELKALVFTPVDGVSGTGVSDGFGLSFTSSAVPAADNATDNGTAVIDQDPPVPPTITGTGANQATTSEKAILPFAKAVVSDTNNLGGDSNVLTITQTGRGTLSGPGLTPVVGSPGVYTVAGDTASALTTALEALSFIAANGVPGNSVTTSFKLSDTDAVFATSLTDSTTSVIDTDPASGSAKVITGSPNGNGTIQGTAGPETLTAYGYNNTIDANGGSGTITAGQGSAKVNAGTGSVTVILNGYSNTVMGGDGNDAVSGSQGSSTVNLGNGNDGVTASGYNNRITLGNGTNTVNGGQGSATIILGSGNNTVTLAGYSDSVTAGDGTNTVTGGDGSETITLGNGTNTVTTAGYGNQITVGNGSNTITAGAGSDTVKVGTNPTNTLGHSSIILAGWENVAALMGGTDRVTGGAGNDLITAEGGSDTFSFKGINDHLILDKGASASIADLGSGLRVDLLSSIGTDTITGFGHDSSGVIDLFNFAGQFSTVGQIMSALHSDGHGGTALSLGAQGSIDFTDVALGQLRASNFKIG